MVDLNFTLVVQLLMFLGFLWVMDRWVLRPLLKTMDKRERTINDDKEQALTDQEAAEALENEYAAALASAHQKAHKKVAIALRTRQEEQLEQRNTLRDVQQQEVAQTREAAEAEINKQRDAFPEMSKAIAIAMLNQLGLGDDAS